ncbi:hypothetical protein BH10PSE2_BH10PSE2_06050 [soil metagenome]
MAFLDWFAPLSPVARASNAQDGGRARIFSADACPLTYSFWVVEEDDVTAATNPDDTAMAARG